MCGIYNQGTNALNKSWLCWHSKWKRAPEQSLQDPYPQRKLKLLKHLVQKHQTILHTPDSFLQAYTTRVHDSPVPKVRPWLGTSSIVYTILISGIASPWMNTQRRSEWAQISGQAAAFEVTAGQCGAQDGSKPQNWHGSRTTETEQSSKWKILKRATEREGNSLMPTHQRNEVECRLRRRRLPQVRWRGLPRASGTGGRAREGDSTG